MHYLIKLCAGIFSVLILVNRDYLTDSNNETTVAIPPVYDGQERQGNDYVTTLVKVIDSIK